MLVVPASIVAALAAHAAAESPNECCGLVAFRDGVAERYLPGINEQPSPTFFRLRPGSPLDFFLEDDGFELAVFHSHPSSAPVPSRTDIAQAGQWQGRPYLIYGLERAELAAWRIDGASVTALRLVTPVDDDDAAAAASSTAGA